MVLGSQLTGRDISVVSEDSINFNGKVTTAGDLTMTAGSVSVDTDNEITAVVSDLGSDIVFGQSALVEAENGLLIAAGDVTLYDSEINNLKVVSGNDILIAGSIVHQGLIEMNAGNDVVIQQSAKGIESETARVSLKTGNDLVMHAASKIESPIGVDLDVTNNLYIANVRALDGEVFIRTDQGYIRDIDLSLIHI